MAKHAKKSKKTATRRRRRIGAVALNASSPLVQYGSIAAGFLLGDKINTAIDGVVGTNIDTKIIAGGQVGIGYMLALRKGAKKNLITTVGGGIMLGAGAKRALTAFGLGRVNGYQMVPAVGGYQNVPAVGSSVGRRRVGAANPGNGGMGWAAQHVAIGGGAFSNGSGSGLMG